LPGEAEPGRARDAHLLELGALVYELHRQGDRAPELLQEKAAELDALDDPRDDGGPASCERCGAPAAPGQLVCTSCGARLALGRRRTRNVAAIAAAAVVAVLGVGAAGFARSEITSDEGATVVAEPEQAPPPAASAGEPQEATQGGGAEAGEQGGGSAAGQETAPAEEPPSEPRSLLLDWPADLTAHTVVLVSSSDRPAALRVARAAAKSGIEAGMLRSDDYNLGTGLWIVFAGRFNTPEGAARQASDLAERYPGAYPQLVEPTG
jgi:predicted nucleic acid-binding Zn ribbon protein